MTAPLSDLLDALFPRGHDITVSDAVLTGTARTEEAMVRNVRQNMRYSGLRFLLADAAAPTAEKYKAGDDQA